MKELYSLPGTAILRHTKIKGGYPPYDPQWELYGETLRQERMLKNMSYRREWAKLYLDQRGLCALCGYEMNMEPDGMTTTWNTVWQEVPTPLEIAYYCTQIAI